jgi:O-antigen/teichoic acid export membrane protein
VSDVLRAPSAGAKVIRGGMLRALAYGAGFLLGIGTSVILLRELGVVRFGQYVTVMSLIAIVSGITDAGLTAVGQREVSLAETAVERRTLVGNLLTLRLVVTPIGVLLALAFTLVAGYPSALVAGTAIAGAGLILINAQATMMLPLSVDLRLGTISGIEVLKQAVLLVGVAVVAAAGASLIGFLAVQVAIGVAVVALTPFLVRFGADMRPAYDGTVTRKLVRETLPMAVALTMNVVYLRILVILMSLMATAVQTGYFSTSFRVFEVFFVVPTLVLSVALPVLAVAGAEDPARLRRTLQRMIDVGLLASVGLVLVIAIVAKPALDILGGHQYAAAVPVLRIQAIALIPVFVGQVCALGLLSVRRQRDLAVANSVALALVVILGLVLIPVSEATGAAVAAVIAETCLALMLFLYLRAARREAVPTLRAAPRVAAAALVAGAVVFIPGISELVAGATAAVLYVAIAFLLRAVPPEVLQAVREARA